MAEFRLPPLVFQAEFTGLDMDAVDRIFGPLEQDPRWTGTTRSELPQTWWQKLRRKPKRFQIVVVPNARLEVRRD